MSVLPPLTCCSCFCDVQQQASPTYHFQSAVNTLQGRLVTPVLLCSVTKMMEILS